MHWPLETSDYQQQTKFWGHSSNSRWKNKERPQTSRKIEIVALYPSKNASGGWYIMAISTGYVLHRYSWDVITVADEMIERVNVLGKKQRQTKVGENFLF